MNVIGRLCSRATTHKFRIASNRFSPSTGIKVPFDGVPEAREIAIVTDIALGDLFRFIIATDIGTEYIQA